MNIKACLLIVFLCLFLVSPIVFRKTLQADSTGLEADDPVLSVVISISNNQNWEPLIDLSSVVAYSMIASLFQEYGIMISSDVYKNSPYLEIHIHGNIPCFFIIYSFVRPVSYESGGNIYSKLTPTWDTTISGHTNQPTNFERNMHIMSNVEHGLRTTFIPEYLKSNTQ